MKKVLGLVVLASFLISTSAFAGGAGNVLTPINTTTEYLGIGGGFEYNLMSERDNKLQNGKAGTRDMVVKNLEQAYGKVTLGIGDNINLYGKIGTANYDLEFIDDSQSDLLEIDLRPGTYTGVGVNFLLMAPVVESEWLSVGVGGDVQGNFFHNEIKNIKRGGVDTVGSIEGSFYGLDGQNSVYMACKLDIKPIETSIIPYMGGYHSWIAVGTLNSLTYRAGTSSVIDEDYVAAFDYKTFGFLMGMDLDIAKYANLNIEGRVGGETGVTAGATVKF